MQRDDARYDRRKATPLNPAGVQSKYKDGPSLSPAGAGLKQRGMPQAVTHGKVWGGNVGPKQTTGRGDHKPGKVARDVGAWGGNVGPHITIGKAGIGAASP